MAKVTPMGLVQGLSGKLCQDSDISFVQRNGRIFTSKMCHPYKGPRTAKQEKAKDDFKQAASRVKAIISQGPGDAEYDNYYSQWQSCRDKYPTFRGFIFSKEYGK